MNFSEWDITDWIFFTLISLCIATVIILIMFIPFAIKQTRQKEKWCADQGYTSIYVRGPGTACLNKERQIIVPPNG